MGKGIDYAKVGNAVLSAGRAGRRAIGGSAKAGQKVIRKGEFVKVKSLI